MMNQNGQQLDEKLIQMQIKYKGKITKLENSFKELSKRLEGKHQALIVDSASEFEKVKAFTEDFCESLHIKLSNEFKQHLDNHLGSFKVDFSSHMRKDIAELLMDNMRSIEKSVMVLEGDMEDLKITQE